MDFDWYKNLREIQIKAVERAASDGDLESLQQFLYVTPELVKPYLLDMGLTSPVRREVIVNRFDWYKKLREIQIEAVECAASNGDLESLKSFLEVTPELMKPYLVDEAVGSPETFCYLAKKMPKGLTMRDEDDFTPVHKVVEYLGDNISVLELIEKLAPEAFEMCSCSGNNPAHLAAYEMREDMSKRNDADYRKGFDYIVSKHPKTLTKKNWRGWTPLDILEIIGIDTSKYAPKQATAKDSKEATDGREL